MRRVFVMTDMEGVAGVNSFTEQSYPDGRYHDLAKRLVTARNAAGFFHHCGHTLRLD